MIGAPQNLLVQTKSVGRGGGGGGPRWDGPPGLSRLLRQSLVFVYI